VPNPSDAEEQHGKGAKRRRHGRHGQRARHCGIGDARMLVNR
jgi:hypothetical protein